MPDCFFCGRPMGYHADYGNIYQCVPCDITEAFPDPEYVPYVRTVTSFIYGGREYPYIDHSAEHWPSPA